MHEDLENLRFIKPWPSITDDWINVHARFGMAAKEGAELETGLLMIYSQVEQIRGRAFGIDHLIVKLEKNGEFTLGRLVSALHRALPLPDSLLNTLQDITKKRNFLIHHFYRHHQSGFYTKEGCMSLVTHLTEVREEFEDAISQLKDWAYETLGTVPDDIVRDHVLEDPDSWKSAQERLYKAMLGKKHAI